MKSDGSAPRLNRRWLFAIYLAFLITLPLGDQPLLAGVDWFTGIKVVFIILAAGFCVALAQDWRPKVEPLYAALLGLVVVGTLVAAWFSPDRMRSLIYGMRLAGMAFLALLTALLVQDEPARGRRIIAWCFGITAIVALLGIYQTLTGRTIGTLGYYGKFGRLMYNALIDEPGAYALVRASGTYDHSSVFGNVLALVLPFGLCLAHRIAGGWRRPARWALVAAIVVCLVALVFTLSRGAWLAFAAGLVVIGYARGGARLGLTLTLFALALALALLPPAGRAVLFSRGNRVQYYDGVRWYSWRTAAHMMAAHPVTGIGPGLFHARYGEYAIPGEALPQSPLHRKNAHNTFLDIGVTSGLVTLAPFLVLCGVVVVRAARRARGAMRDDFAGDPVLAVALAAALAAFFVQSMVQSLEHQELFWIIVGIVMAGTPFSRKGMPTTAENTDNRVPKD